MDEAACEELIQAAIEVPMMRGGTKGALPEEQVTIDFLLLRWLRLRRLKKVKFSQKKIFG